MPKSQVTMADVAELAQVSKMSVSRVLNGQGGVSEKTRQRIAAAIEELGYTPNEVVGTRTTTGLITLLTPGFASTYMGEVLRGVSEAAERLGYRLVLHTQRPIPLPEDSDQPVTFLQYNLVEGVLMVVPHHYEALVDELKSHHLPYVVIDHHGSTDEEPSVTATNRNGVLDAMRHLLALGHQRIGFVTGRMDIACSHDRLQGYRDGLAEVDLPFNPDLVREGDYSQPVGFQQARSLLQMSDPPTAIIASNDLMAFGAMDAAKDARLVIGRDISIVGFDDVYMASQVYPPLTTVRQPLDLMGKTALEMLVALIQGRTVLNLRQKLPTELIIRESTGRAH